MSKHLFTKKSGSRFLCFFFLAILLFGQYSQMPTAHALAPCQQKLFQERINYFDCSVACDTSGSGAGATATASSLNGETTGPAKAVQEIVWTTLINGNLDPMHAAAVMGNLAIEGGDYTTSAPGDHPWNPERTEIAGPLNGAPSKDPSSVGPNFGYGLMGWTPGTRLTDEMKEMGISGVPWSAETQAAVILGNIQGKAPSQYDPSIGKAFLATNTLDAAVTAYQGQSPSGPKGFENPSDPTGSLDRRKSRANDFLTEFGGSGVTATGSSATGDSSGSCCGSGVTTVDSIPVGTLPSFIPEPYNGAITQGANAHHVAPALVAAIFSEENGLGSDSYDPNTSNLPAAWANFVKSHTDPNSGWPTSSAGATGPFQFLPSTWTGYGYPLSKINDLATAADAAAKLLGSNGATTDQPESQWKNAIYSYNHADWYVNAVLKMYEYYNSQPGATPSGGGTVVAGATTGSGSSSCGCSATPASGGDTIVIDPGHSGNDISDTDPQTGLYDHDWPNVPEITEVYGVAQQVETKLKADGYNVIMTKNSANDSVSFRQRADIANQANAALALSIHDSHDTSWDDMYGSGDGGQVYAQVVGGYRQNSAGLGRGTDKVAFTDSSVAQKSQQYAQIFADQRTKDEGHKVAVTVNSFDGRSDVDPGNLSMVQLFAKVPWVYNEVGAPSGALPQSDLDKYAQGLINSVEKAVPISGGTGSTSTATPTDTSGGSSCGGAVAGNVTQTAVNLAWPEPYNPTSAEKGRDSALTPTPAYKQAMQQYNKADYASTGEQGDDCGVFVSTVMRASGADPDYPEIGTLSQAQYVLANPDKYDVIFPATDTSQLQPGDILILNAGTTKDSGGTINLPTSISPDGGHTFIYVGKQPGNGYNEASASYLSRSANLDVTQLSDGRGQYMIARLK